MEDDLARIRERMEIVPARFRTADAVESEIRKVRIAIRDAYLEANLDANDEIRAELDLMLAPLEQALDSPTLAEAYLAAVPCVETLVSAELDTETSGERGLGRASTQPPRLAGAFRDQLRKPAAREDFAVLIERMILQTYAGTAAALQTFYEEPALPHVCPAEELFEKWVPAMYAGTRTFGENTMGTISSAHAETERAIEVAAERHGLLGGFRSGKKNQTLLQAAGFWVSAGAALYWAPIQRQ